MCTSTPRSIKILLGGARKREVRGMRAPLRDRLPAATPPSFVVRDTQTIISRMRYIWYGTLCSFIPQEDIIFAVGQKIMTMRLVAC